MKARSARAPPAASGGAGSLCARCRVAGPVAARLLSGL